MRYAGEVYQPEGRKGAPPAGEGEASQEERRRARAAKKRAGKKRTAQKVRRAADMPKASGALALKPISIAWGSLEGRPAARSGACAPPLHTLLSSRSMKEGETSVPEPC